MVSTRDEGRMATYIAVYGSVSKNQNLKLINFLKTGRKETIGFISLEVDRNTGKIKDGT